MKVQNQRKLICPICKTEMETVSRYDVEIDICPKCKGVWLDRGELNKIVDSVSQIYDNLHNYLPDDSNYQMNKEKEDNEEISYNYSEESEEKNYLRKIFEIG